MSKQSNFINNLDILSKYESLDEFFKRVDVETLSIENNISSLPESRQSDFISFSKKANDIKEILLKFKDEHRLSENISDDDLSAFEESYNKILPYFKKNSFEISMTIFAKKNHIDINDKPSIKSSVSSTSNSRKL